LHTWSEQTAAQSLGSWQQGYPISLHCKRPRLAATADIAYGFLAGPHSFTSPVTTLQSESRRHRRSARGKSFACSKAQPASNAAATSASRTSRTRARGVPAMLIFCRCLGWARWFQSQVLSAERLAVQRRARHTNGSLMLLQFPCGGIVRCNGLFGSSRRRSLQCRCYQKPHGQQATDPPPGPDGNVLQAAGGCGQGPGPTSPHASAYSSV